MMKTHVMKVVIKIRRQFYAIVRPQPSYATVLRKSNICTVVTSKVNCAVSHPFELPSEVNKKSANALLPTGFAPE